MLRFGGSDVVPIAARNEAGKLEHAADDTRVTPARRESGEGRNRTGDTTVFSRVLYQLSYLAAD